MWYSVEQCPCGRDIRVAKIWHDFMRNHDCIHHICTWKICAQYTVPAYVNDGLDALEKYANGL